MTIFLHWASWTESLKGVERASFSGGQGAISAGHGPRGVHGRA